MGSYGFIFHILYGYTFLIIFIWFQSAPGIFQPVTSVTGSNSWASLALYPDPIPTLSDSIWLYYPFISFQRLVSFGFGFGSPVNAKTYDGRKRIEKVIQVLRSWDSWDILRNLETFEDFIMPRIPRRLVLCDMLSILSQYPYSRGFSLACHYIHMHKPYSWQLSSSNESENVDYGWKRCACTRLGLAAWIGSRDW